MMNNKTMAKKNLGKKLLQSVREMKADKKARVTKVTVSPTLLRATKNVEELSVKKYRTWKL